MIRADVSWESLVERHVDEVMAENPLEEEAGKKDDGGRRGGVSGQVSRDGPGRPRVPRAMHAEWSGTSIKQRVKDSRKEN